MTRRVSFGPSPTSQPLNFTRHDNNVKHNKTPEQPMISIWAFKPPKHSTSFSAMRFLGRIKAKFARALGFVSTSRKISSSSSISSSNDSCSCNCESLVRSRSYVEALDLHRAQAIEDCIQFLNSSSSSSFQRSKSLSSFSY